MTGGGFGGCVIALIPAGRVTAVRDTVTQRFNQNRWPAPHFLDATPSAAAQRRA